MELDTVIQNALSELESLQHSSLTIGVYKNGYNRIKKYLLDLNISKYTKDAMGMYLFHQKQRMERGEIKVKHYRFLRRLAYTLYECQQSGSISWVAEKSRDFNNPYFQNLYSTFFSLQEKELSPKTIRTMRVYVYGFLIYLQTKGFKDIKEVSATVIQSYIINFASERKNPDLGNFVYALRKFWEYLKEIGETALDARYIIQKPAVHRKSVMPYFSKDQIDELLNAAKGEGMKKKRDYAMMTLAAYTGMRFVDVANLKLTDIDWRAHTIKLVQLKTGQSNTLPLSTEVGNAIADYIINARPECTSPYIFLRTSAPFSKLKSGSHIVKSYLPSADAGISPIGFHAFRRGMGTRMLECDINVSIISQVLGHSEVDSIKPYISLSVEKLRECCMRMQELGIPGRKQTWI
ncbi:MAG: tyrosine-type recombinase/integrase [Clostridiales bacterium]|nr:tyrosine-type recombinase/integrase [Clostridiales bacterium]